jgi:hypothetical protein
VWFSSFHWCHDDFFFQKSNQWEDRMIVMQFKRLQEKEGMQTRRADELSYFSFSYLWCLWLGYHLCSK